MNAKELIKSLEKLHPDFLDQDILMMDVDTDGKPIYSFLSYVGIIILGDLTFAAIGSDKSVRQLVKENRVRRIDTGLPPTEEELNPPTDEA